MQLPRLYAILDADLAARRGLEPLAVADDWLDAGVRLIQLRAKTMAGAAMLELAEALVARCHFAGASLVVNDRADIARTASADGVHVGQTDLTPGDVRRLIGMDMIVGVSTHNQRQLDAAMREPVDYVAIGPVFDTASKANPDPIVGLDGVRAAAGRVADRRPIVAIGGITLERAPAVIAAGAASVAVIADLLVGRPRDRARLFLDALR